MKFKENVALVVGSATGMGRATVIKLIKEGAHVIAFDLREDALNELEEELERPLTLHCKVCKSWYVSDNFDIICPECGHDGIYAAYNCMNCGKWFYEEEPREDLFCPKCEDVRLVRREKEEVEKILAKEGKLAKKFEPKEREFNIIDL